MPLTWCSALGPPLFRTPGARWWPQVGRPPPGQAPAPPCTRPAAQHRVAFGIRTSARGSGMSPPEKCLRPCDPPKSTTPNPNLASERPSSRSPTLHTPQNPSRHYSIRVLMWWAESAAQMHQLSCFQPLDIPPISPPPNRGGSLVGSLVQLLAQLFLLPWALVQQNQAGNW